MSTYLSRTSLTRTTTAAAIMFGQKIAVVALSALGVVSAQSQNFTISPDSVEIATRGTILALPRHPHWTRGRTGDSKQN